MSAYIWQYLVVARRVVGSSFHLKVSSDIETDDNIYVPGGYGKISIHAIKSSG
jgi:hypothetical protein